MATENSVAEHVSPADIEAAFPDLDIIWLPVSAGDEQVFLVTYDALPG